MPDVLLSVPHFEQSRDGLCLPACARMVLTYWGQDLSEARLAQLLGTKALMLDYWLDAVTSHVVVVVGFDETHVYLNDPAISSVPQLTVWGSFLAAWTEFDETAVVIYPV